MGRIQGKVALITGAGTGVGRACMELFAEEGASVFGVSRTKKNLDNLVADIEARGNKAVAIPGDVSKESEVKAAVEFAVETFGRIDILVHAAGVGYSWEEKSPGSMADVVNTPPDKWREVMQINLDGYYLVCHHVIPEMLKSGGGSIVAVTSISGFQGLAEAHAYTAAKAGMINLTRSLSVAYAKQGIRSNCIAPGFIDTPMVASVIGMFDDPDVALQLTPMARPGTPREMAYGCLYLASDEASYCNGSVLTIDGGTFARQ